MATGTAPSVLEDRLSEFLSGYGLAIGDLRSEVEEALGWPCAVLAAGSVLHGFGNSRSDVDLCVIVDRENLTRLPMMSYKEKARVDVTYYGSAEVQEWIEGLRDGEWPVAGPVTPTVWRRQRNRLQAISRFASGLVLTSRDGWGEQLSVLRSQWLADRMVEWWRIEALRQRTAANWLAEVKPWLASQRWCDAVLAALEVRAALGGQLAGQVKWLPEKLKAMDDQVGLAMLRDAIRIPHRAEDIESYGKRCLDTYLRLMPDEPQPVRVELHYAQGTTVTSAMGSGIVTRWGMRGVQLPASALPAPSQDAVVWQGTPDQTPPSPIKSLFTEDMLWLSISRTPR